MRTMARGSNPAGFAILIVGLAIGANMLHVPPKWIAVGALVLIGIGIVTGVTHARHKARRSPLTPAGCSKGSRCEAAPDGRTRAYSYT
ncbi:MAG TPA: hypothetical protein VML54_10225 [Candidatus Limnocylindrales bacterium]|nr:hypothetical protein [Candidatus Limnocylindrales bacterium]